MTKAELENLSKDDLIELELDLYAMNEKLREGVAQPEGVCDVLLSEQAEMPEAQRLLNRYEKHRQALFVFVHHPNVLSDNNAAERAMRNSVIHRQVTGGFRSETGPKAHTVVSSVVDTARKRDQDVRSSPKPDWPPGAHVPVR